MEFKNFSLGDLCLVKSSKRIYAKEYVEVGIPFYRSKEIIQLSEGENISTDLFISPERFNELNSKFGSPKIGDILITSVGTIGVPYLVDHENFYFKDGNLTWLSEFDERINNLYIYYWLTSRVGQNEIEKVTIGSTQKALTIVNLKSINIKVPPLKIQNKITDILSLIDNKLQINRESIANLEELSQTLFKRWFVDFEFPDEEGNPYKSNGGKFVNSELGQIPIGWNIRELKDIAHIVMGQSPKSDTYNYEKEGLPLINGATDFNHGIINPTKYTNDPKKIGSQNDYIFGVRATVGRVTELDKEYAIGRGAGIASPINEFYREFLYQILNKAFKEFSNTASGSVYLNVSKNDLNSYNIIIPTDDILRAFHSLTNSYLKDISLLKLENKNLTELRDTLLPKLMSGDIELPDELEVDEHAKLLQ